MTGNVERERERERERVGERLGGRERERAKQTSESLSAKCEWATVKTCLHVGLQTGSKGLRVDPPPPGSAKSHVLQNLRKCKGRISFVGKARLLKTCRNGHR